jgi:tetratricopeptide (TPR) repeat protein
MKKNTFFILIAVVLAFVTYGFADQTQIDVARQRVKERAYDEALSLYSASAAFVRTDPALMIEWARVYSYNNMHAEAIVLFEEIRQRYPETEKDIIFELANQYKWNDAVRESLPVYRKALEYFPDNSEIKKQYGEALAWSGEYRAAVTVYDDILSENKGEADTLLKKADVLSWHDKLEDAYFIYENLLSNDPDNTDALNGIARMHVWQGRHRQGINEYKEILATDPYNESTLEGLAFAYRWEGENQRAVDVLEKLLEINPERRAAGILYSEIQSSQKPYCTSYTAYSDDKYDLAIFTQGLRTGVHISYDTTIEALYEWQRFRKPNNPLVDAHRGGVGMSHRIGDLFEVNSYLYGTHFDSVGFTSFTNASWFTYKPFNTVRFDMSYNRETYDDMTALARHVISDTGGISFDYKPNRFWFFSGKYSRGFFSDGNVQDALLAKAEYRIFREPYLKTYYNYYYSDFSEQKNNGYFNPGWIQAHTMGLYGSHKILNKVFFEGQSSIGYEMQDPGIRTPTYFGALGITYSVCKNWLFSIRCEYFDARPDMPSKGYSRKSAIASLTYNFGGETSEIRDATVPSRPIPGAY